MEKRVNYKLVNLTLVVLMIFFLYKTGNLWMGIINKIVGIMIPFLFAFALAYALHPILKYMQKKKIPKGLGVTIIVLTLALIIAALIYVVSTILVGQLSNLFNSILAFVNKLSNYEFSSDVNFSGLESSLNDIFKNIMASVGQYVSNGTIHLVNSSLGILSKICIAAAAFVYLLIDMDKIRDGVRNFFKKRTKKTYEFVSSLDHQMKKYLSGLVIVMIISVIEYSLVYSIIGHPDALLLGLLAGFANLIPYFGGIMNNCVAAVTAFVISPSLFIKTLIVFTVLSMVDSYVINANVYGKTNSIHPLIVIFSVFAGSACFGIMGIVVSFPMAIIGVTAFKFYKDNINDTMKTEEKIKVFHDYIVNNTKFDTEIENSNDRLNSTSYTAYGLLINHKAICGGYTDTMAIYLDKLNIPNIRISTSEHVWNLVYIDNSWLNLDVTWDDPVTSNGSDMLMYDYYLIDTNTLLSKDTTQHNFNKEIYLEAN